MMTRALVIPPRPLFEEADSPMAASERTPIKLDGRSGQSGKMGEGRGGVQNMRPNVAQGQDISVWEIKSRPRDNTVQLQPCFKKALAEVQVS